MQLQVRVRTCRLPLSSSSITGCACSGENLTLVESRAQRRWKAFAITTFHESEQPHRHVMFSRPVNCEYRKPTLCLPSLHRDLVMSEQRILAGPRLKTISGQAQAKLAVSDAESPACFCKLRRPSRSMRFQATPHRENLQSFARRVRCSLELT